MARSCCCCGLVTTLRTIFALLFPVFVSTSPLFASVWYEDGVFTVRHDTGSPSNAVAWAQFDDQISNTGWSFLEVHTNRSYENAVQSYSAGMVEGFITRDLIYKQYMNTAQGYCMNREKTCNAIATFLRENALWIQQQILANPADPYWHQVSLVLGQLRGLQDGYLRTTSDWDPATEQPPYFDNVKPVFGLLLLQLSGDLEDLAAAVQKQEHIHHEPLSKVLGGGSCSALVKLVAGGRELFVAHDSWNSYQAMLRVLKKYSFPFSKVQHQGAAASGDGFGAEISAPVQTFSSYPGTLFSMDDFYLLSSGLVTTETTIGNGNATLWKYVVPRGTVLEWIRTIVANRLAVTGADWTGTFAKYNSGTYNNEWMVVDYKLFKPGHPPPAKGLLTVLEQLPGMVVARDTTSVLLKQAYWPSYNTPYFPEIFNASGQREMVAKYGDWFTYDKTPRARIFKRDQGKVTDLPSLTKLMRYNDYKHDKFSTCKCVPPYSAENGISSRSDLNPANGSYPFGALGHRPHGGIDMKATSSELLRDLEFLSISSPTYDQQPPFRWSTSHFNEHISHMGHPDLWQFPLVQHKWAKKSDATN